MSARSRRRGPAWGDRRGAAPRSAAGRPLRPSSARALRHGSGRPRRRFAQHFLEPVWVEKVLSAVRPAPTDVFLEIGPGRGALTHALARTAARIVAVEIDRDLAAYLRELALPNVEIVTGDFLALDPRTLGNHFPDRAAPVRVVGNLPYNVSSPILFHLFDLRRQGMRLEDATLMLQREVVDRITAGPGSRDYGPLAVVTSLHADATCVLDLPPGAFRPMPGVHSAVVRLRFREPDVPRQDRELLETLVRRLFTRRRKTLLNALRPFAAERGADPARLLAAASLDPARRPETLQVSELARLAVVLGTASG